MIFPNLVFTRCFRTRKRGKHALGNLHIVLTRGERIVLLMKVSPSWCFFVAFSAKLFRWISFVHNFWHRIIFSKFLVFLPNPSMVYVIVIGKNKATNSAFPGSCRIFFNIPIPSLPDAWQKDGIWEVNETS